MRHARRAAAAVDAPGVLHVHCDRIEQHARRLLVVGHAHHFSIEILRARIDVIGPDQNDPAVNDQALGVQRVGALELADIDPRPRHAHPILEISRLRQDSIRRTQRIRDDEHGDALADFARQQIQERFRRDEIRRFDDDRFLRSCKDVHQARLRLGEEVHRGDILLTE